MRRSGLWLVVTHPKPGKFLNTLILGRKLLSLCADCQLIPAAAAATQSKARARPRPVRVRVLVSVGSSGIGGGGEGKGAGSGRGVRLAGVLRGREELEELVVRRTGLGILVLGIDFSLRVL